MAKLVFKRRRVRRVEFALPFAARALCWVLILLMSGLPGQMLGCICNNPDPCYGCRTKGGDPVDLGRMSVYIQDTELSPTVLPGARTPAALQFTRQYSGDMLDTNYGGAYTGPLGARWTHNYNVILTDKGSGSVEVRTWDGSVEVFATNTPGVYYNVGDGETKLSTNATGFVWQLRNGTVYNFTTAQANRLMSIVDPIGNTNALAYDGSGLLTSVKDNLGRSNTFTYTASGYISNFVDPIGRTSTYKYDASGQLTNVSDSIGSKVTFGYTNISGVTTGIVNVITNARGKVHTYAYDWMKKVTAQTNSAGVVIVWGRDDATHYVTNILYDGLGGSNISLFAFSNPNRLLTNINAAGGLTHYVRDSLNRPIKVIDRMGFVTTNQYADSGCACLIAGSLINRIDPLGRINQWQYETSFYNRTAFTNARSFVTRWAYDNKGNLTGFTNALTNVTTCAYDSKGNRTNIVDANNHTYAFSYDTYGSLITNIDPLGNKTIYQPDIIGRVTNRIDALNCSNQYVYDVRDRLVTRTNALGKKSGWNYDGNGNVIGFTNELGYVTTNSYDDLDRLATVTLPASNAAFLSYGYDFDGNRTVVTNALGNATRYAYDAVKRLTAVTNALSKVWTFKYDGNSHRTNSVDPNAHANNYVYDAAGQMTAMTNALNQVVQFQYDLEGSLTNLMDARGNAVAYAYDLVNRLTNINYAASDNEKFVYDPVGNLTNYVTRAGQTNFYTYDAGNRLATNNWLGDTNVTWFAFDGANQLILGQRKVGSANTSKVIFSYDSAGRLTNESQLMTTSTNRTVSYQYNDAGWLTNLTYPDGSYVGYQYNRNGWVTNILDWGTNSICKYEYDAAGRRTKRTLTNSTFTVYEYDAANQLTNIWHRQIAGGATNTISQYIYGYDDGGNRTWVKRANGKGDVFRYDATDQITNVLYEATNVDTIPASWTNEAKYTYDASGNYNTVNITNTASWEYNGGDSLNRYINLLVSWTTGGVGGFTYTYDRNGNLATDFSGWGFNYDRENRLLTATNATTSVTNTYDAFNRLVERQVGANKTRYIYDKSWRVLAEYNQSDALIAKYVYGPEIDEPLRMNRAGTNYFYHASALGTITEVTSTNGTKLETYNYDVYGAPTIRDGSGTVIANSTISNRFMFQGRDRDPDTGLYHFRYRYYSSSLGRFLQPDPIRQQGGLNLYAFLHNNPVMFTDFLGLKICTTPGRVSGKMTSGSVETQTRDYFEIPEDGCILCMQIIGPWYTIGYRPMRRTGVPGNETLPDNCAWTSGYIFGIATVTRDINEFGWGNDYREVVNTIVTPWRRSYVCIKEVPDNCPCP